MSRRPDWEAGARLRFLVRLAGAIVASFLLATTAAAGISSINPSEGTIEPGGSATASFTVTGSLTSCFTAAAPSGFSVSLRGLGLGILLPANCALGGTRVTMTVSAGSNVSPGDYQVTITETAVGGDLISTHEWPFTVPAPVTTTTTIPETTTTTRAQTTTTTSNTTTSTQSTPTTSSAGATTSTGGATDTTAGSAGAGSSTVSTSPGTPTTVSDAPDSGGGDDTAAGEAGAELSDQAPDEASDEISEDDDDDDDEALAAGSGDDELPYNRYPATSGDVAPEVLSRTVFSDQLRSQLSRAVPLTVADAVLSPVVITEFLFRSLLQSAMSLLVPILIATLVGSWMAWRMREEIDDDELALSRQSMG